MAGVVDRHSVNHREGEFTQSVEVLADVATRGLRPGMAGTQTIDRRWRSIKTCFRAAYSLSNRERMRTDGTLHQ